MNRINPLWLTPIWEVQTNFDDSFNQTLMDEMYAIGVNMATEAQPKTSLWDYNTPALARLKETMLEQVKLKLSKYLEEVNSLNLSFKADMAWVNVKAPGESIELHGHPDAAFAATYYVKTQENCGNLVLWTQKGNEIALPPVTGKLVFFPAYVLHYIKTNKSNDLRISISADITTVIDPNAPNALVLRSWCNDMLKIKGWQCSSN